MADSRTRLYGLIGFPLTHSYSEGYFNTKFESEHIDAKYINFELPDMGDLMEVISEYPDLCGLNVTIPYKEQVLPYLDEIDDEAKAVGAVNVIKFLSDKKNGFRLKGYNSDVTGFRESLRPLLKPDMDHALVLGTGGAAKAVAFALRQLGVEPTFVSRTPSEGMLGYDDITPEVIATNKVIVNTTPLGMYPHTGEAPQIPYSLLTPSHLCYDLIYNPSVTQFMKLSEEAGATVKNGLEMLLLQAFESWNIWNK